MNTSRTRVSNRGKASMLASAGIATLALATAATPVQAQDAGVECVDADNDGVCDAVAAPAAEPTGIVVTGSRLTTVTPYNSPDPIAIVSPEIAQKEGKIDLASALQSSPIAAGSTQITAALSSNFVTDGGPGAQTIDLRGLGPNRTLVLLNGRRAGPAGTRGGVSSFDLNVLPLSIIKDIQILKTGASSIYGSDAVAGVVNILTKDRQDGFVLNLNTAVPFEGGGEEYRVSGSWGKTFDRGHIMVAADYKHTNELKRGDRSYLACPEAYIFDEAGNRADLIDPRTGQPKCEDLRWGHVWTYNLIDNLYLDGPGGPNTGVNTSDYGSTVLMQYQYPNGPGSGVKGVPTFGPPVGFADFSAPAGWFPTGYDAASQAVENAYHPFVEEQTIIPQTDLYTAYAEGSYELSDAVELFGEFLFNRRETYQNGWRQFWNFGYTGDLYSTGAGNYFNYWADGWQGLNLISPTAITNQNGTGQTVDYYRGVGGVRGDLGGAGNWRYEIYGQYSRSNGRYRSQQILQDSYDTGYFQYYSCAGTVTPFSGKNCIDIPWTDPYFLRGELTPEQIDFLFDWEEGKTVYTQASGEAVISGEAFQLPAGPLAVALGVSFRRDRINDTPGDISYFENPYYDASAVGTQACEDDGDLPRIERRYICDEFRSNVWGSTVSGITAGKTETAEIFGEISVPLLADRPFFEELTVSAAARLTNVKATRAIDGVSDSDNGNFTYKIGANWALTDWLRFRGTYGTSFRAPALFELFKANESSFAAQGRIDPCINYTAGVGNGSTSERVAANCAADGIPGTYNGAGVTATVFSQGGLGQLEAETSKALVVGAVLTPKFGFLGDTSFSLALDYFDIEVNDEISQLGAANILFGCYDSDDFASEPLCDLFTRGQNVTAPYQINEVFDQYVNIASQRQRGLDLSANLRHDFGKLGRLNLSADVTWQFKDDFQLLPGSEVISFNGESGSPKWVGDFRATWAFDSGLSLFYGVNVIGKTSDQDDFEDRFGGPCVDSFNQQGTATTADDLPIYGTYCPDLTAPTVFYHNASLTQEIADGRFAITAGVSNLFNTRPPRVSVLNGSQISMLGPVIAASQYPFTGRRGFINVTAKF